MKGWKECKLGEFIKIKHGYAFSGKNITDENTGKILVTPGNFHIGGGFKSDKFKFFNDNYPKDYEFVGGEIIVTMTDLSKETDALGYSAKVPFDKQYRYLHNQRVGLVEFISDSIDKDFIYWLMRTFDYHWFIVGGASGTSIMHTSPSRIVEYAFNCPPLPEQKAIAAVLSSLDDKIDLLHRQNKTLEAMAETLFRQWFVEEADEGWEKGKLSQYVDIGIGRTPPRQEHEWFSESETDVKWISIKDLGNDGTYIFNTAEYLTHNAVERFNIPVIPANTVVLSFKMTVGRVAITTEKMLSNEAIAHFKFKHDTPFSVAFIYFYLKTYQYDSLGSTSSIVTAINSAMIKDLSIIIPDINKMNQFNNVVKRSFEKIRSNQVQIRTLEKLRDTLLPKLMSGEVRVKV